MTDKYLKQFDEEFVKDLGPDIEPVFLDPDGCVGPVKQFLEETIEAVKREVLNEVLSSLSAKNWILESDGLYVNYEQVLESVKQIKQPLNPD